MNHAASDVRRPVGPLLLASVAAIAAVTLIAYQPSLGLGFYWDDWGDLQNLSRLGPLQFLARAFNPSDPNLLQSYRPMKGLLYASVQVVFGFNPIAFHGVNILLHLVNSVLLFLICRQLAGQLRVALLAGLVFASLPLNGMAVLLINAPDAQATVFYLLGVWFWLLYLAQGHRRYLVLTLASYIVGLLTKEYVITLPATLFLADRLLLRAPTTLPALVRRYSGPGLVSACFLAFELLVQPGTQLYLTYRPALGPHIVSNAIVYLNWLSFPWHADFSLPSVWLPLVVLAFILMVIWTRSAVLVFLGIEAIVGIAHMLTFQWQIFDVRHLYLAGIVPAVALAMLVERGTQFLARHRLAVLAILGACLLLLLQALGVAAYAHDYAQKATVERTPFRDVSRAHPTFPAGTRLYFINPPTVSDFLSGMFTLRYGNGISVSGTDRGEPANLRRYEHALVYDFDSTGKAHEVQVDKESSVTASPDAPIAFSNSIHLSGYELSSQSLAQGQTLVLLLYWYADTTVDRDYTVFVHLIDSNGQVIKGTDSQPRGGKAPTSSWRPGASIVDHAVIPIDPSVPPQGGYALEVGLYDLATGQRLSILDELGTPVADRVSIGPFKVQ